LGWSNGVGLRIWSVLLLDTNLGEQIKLLQKIYILERFKILSFFLK